MHGGKSHPHIHVVFWDKSVRVKNPFTSPQIQNAIRKQMIKDTFAEKILAFAKEKDLAVQEMRRITDELVELSERLFALRTMIPEHGRIAYGLLPPESREKTDELVQSLLLEIPEIRKCFERYVDAKCSMAGLYTADEEWLLKQKKKFEKEAEKMLANPDIVRC